MPLVSWLLSQFALLSDAQYEIQRESFQVLMSWYLSTKRQRDEVPLRTWQSLLRLNRWPDKSWIALESQLKEVYESKAIYLKAAHEMFKDMGFPDQCASAILRSISRSNLNANSTVFQSLRDIWEQYSLLSKFDGAISFPMKNNNLHETRKRELLTRFHLIIYSRFVPLSTDLTELENIMVDAKITLEQSNRAKDMMTACDVYLEPEAEEKK